MPASSVNFILFGYGFGYFCARLLCNGPAINSAINHIIHFLKP